MLIYRNGDLMDAQEPFIIHGCNAQGVMGSGVAKAIRDKHPEAYQIYREVYEEQGNLLLMGQVVWKWITIPEDPKGTRVIGNAITQEFYGRDGKRYVDYDAVRDAFAEVRRYLDEMVEDLGDSPYVAIPRIGAGLGGGDWDTIAKIIQEEMGDHDVVVYDL